MVKPMRSTIRRRKRLSGSGARSRRWSEPRTSTDDGGGTGDDSSSLCSCSDSSLDSGQDATNVGKVDFRKYGFTVFDVPEELTGRRAFEDAAASERKLEGGGGGWERVLGGVGSYCGTLISGAAFGAVSMGIFMVRFFGCFYNVDDHLGSLTPT
ncbi:unnamed protein product [Cuscuta epithymum]|uniref:Uncharacterized protein n=1 Tax=Cuscuta epithymum TaxID=186058 RepID=A0AAV0FWP0_9ASTE|nr:unnamed protein product [Cuscuta epithymum]